MGNEIINHLRQWRSQGGGPGGPWPPQTLVNVFFLQLISGNLEVTRKCQKNSRNRGNLSDLDLLLPKKTIISLPPPPRMWLAYGYGRSRNISATTPPPLNLPGLRRSLKISATSLPPPPHRIWSASGDHGKLAPPQKQILATPLICGGSGAGSLGGAQQLTGGGGSSRNFPWSPGPVFMSRS